jgi:hypothetical protein
LSKGHKKCFLKSYSKLNLSNFYHIIGNCARGLLFLKRYVINAPGCLRIDNRISKQGEADMTSRLRFFMAAMAVVSLFLLFAANVQAQSPLPVPVPTSQQTVNVGAGVTFNGNFGDDNVGSFTSGNGSILLTGQDPTFTSGIAEGTGAGAGDQNAKNKTTTNGTVINKATSAGNSTLTLVGAIPQGAGPNTAAENGLSQAGSWLTVGDSNNGAGGGSGTVGEFGLTATVPGTFSVDGIADADNSAKGYSKNSANKANAGITVLGAADGTTALAGTTPTSSNQQAGVLGQGEGVAQSTVGDPSSTKNNYGLAQIGGTAGFQGVNPAGNMAGNLLICGDTSAQNGPGALTVSAAMAASAGISVPPSQAPPTPQPVPCGSGGGSGCSGSH